MVRSVQRQVNEIKLRCSEIRARERENRSDAQANVSLITNGPPYTLESLIGGCF